MHFYEKVHFTLKNGLKPPHWRFNFDTFVILVVLAAGGWGLHLALASDNAVDPRTDSGNVPTTWLKAGDTLAELHPVSKLNAELGNKVHLEKRLMYWFAPWCIWCAANVANIKSIAQAGGSGSQVVGVAASDPQLVSYVREHDLNFPVLEISEQDPAVDQFGPTPTTLLVGPGNVIEKVWHGAFSESDRQEIEQLFRTQNASLLMRPSPDGYAKR